jgi:hypothetical protein
VVAIAGTQTKSRAKADAAKVPKPKSIKKILS